MSIKKIISVVFVLLLSGCTFPSMQTATANPQLVDEIVSSTLTAQVNGTSESTGASATVKPTETFTIVSETPTSTMTEIIASETPTITVVPNGFRETLGAPTWKDSLDDGEAFGLDESGYQDDNTEIFIEDGAMVLSSSSQYGYRGWRLTTVSPTDVYIEATFEVESCNDEDVYGLVYRAPDYSNGLGYYLGITCEGKYNVTKWTDSGSSTIISSAASPEINSGVDETNVIGIQMVGSDFFIHINDVLITQFSDKSFTEGGHFGVFIVGQGNGNLVVRMNEIAYWNLQ